MKPRECPSAAVLPCCCPGIQVDTALDVSAQAYRQTPRWTAANLPHECTRVRCDVSGSCLSKLCCAPITRCKAGLGAVATDEPRAPPHASVRKKKALQEHFRGKVVFPVRLKRSRRVVKGMWFRIPKERLFIKGVESSSHQNPL